jgi:hypothetical protein
MATRTIELDRNDLDKSIEVLSSAAQALQLTRFQSLSYRALMLSVDVAIACFVLSIIIIIAAAPARVDAADRWEWVYGVVGVLSVVSSLSILVGLVSLVLNIPLFVRIFRERTRLKKHGLASLSRSLWIESRRSRWISRARSALLIGVGMFFVAGGAALSIAGALTPERRTELFLWAASVAIVGVLLLGARYLRNQRERIALTENAEELKRALQRLRERAGDAEVVTVPSELLEQTANIEAAQIAKERKDAVLRSIASPSKEYAVAFDRSAMEQRAMLSIAERVELEDLVEQLGEEVAKPEPQEGVTAPAKDTTLRGSIKSKRVEIDYVIDRTSRRIRINTVRQREGGSGTSVNGAGHA